METKKFPIGEDNETCSLMTWKSLYVFLVPLLIVKGHNVFLDALDNEVVTMVLTFSSAISISSILFLLMGFTTNTEIYKVVINLYPVIWNSFLCFFLSYLQNTSCDLYTLMYPMFMHFKFHNEI